jgi:hypothetical protein
MASPVYSIGDVCRLEILVRTNTTSLATAAAAGATTITVYDTTGYADTNTVVVAPSQTPEHAPQETRVVSGTPTANVITLTVALAFPHPAGTLVSELVAGTVTAIVKLPDGTTSVGSVSNVSTGRYRVDHTATMAGKHWIEWTVTSPAASGTFAFDVASDIV